MQEAQAERGADQAREFWSAGDYDRLVEMIQTSGPDGFVSSIQGEAGENVLDIACGTGALALPLARRGFRVTGIDISPTLIEAARRNASLAGLSISFDEGAMEAMKYPDGVYDTAVSMLGVMFTAAPAAAMNEISRVLKLEGRSCWAIGRLTASQHTWVPRSPTTCRPPPSRCRRPSTGGSRAR